MVEIKNAKFLRVYVKGMGKIVLHNLNTQKDETIQADRKCFNTLFLLNKEDIYSLECIDCELVDLLKYFTEVQQYKNGMWVSFTPYAETDKLVFRLNDDKFHTFVYHNRWKAFFHHTLTLGIMKESFPPLLYLNELPRGASFPVSNVACTEKAEDEVYHFAYFAKLENEKEWGLVFAQSKDHMHTAINPEIQKVVISETVPEVLFMDENRIVYTSFTDDKTVACSLPLDKLETDGKCIYVNEDCDELFFITDGIEDIFVVGKKNNYYLSSNSEKIKTFYGSFYVFIDHETSSLSFIKEHKMKTFSLGDLKDYFAK